MVAIATMKAAAYFLFLPVTVSFNEQSLFLSFSFALTMDWRNKSPSTEAEQLFLLLLKKDLVLF